MPTATAARALAAVRKAELDAVVDNDLEPANVAVADRADQDGAGRDDDYADVKDEDDEQSIAREKRMRSRQRWEDAEPGYYRYLKRGAVVFMILGAMAVGLVTVVVVVGYYHLAAAGPSVPVWPLVVVVIEAAAGLTSVFFIGSLILLAVDVARNIREMTWQGRWGRTGR